MHFAVRREFRPLDILQLIFSPVSHPYRGNATVIDWGPLLRLFLVLGLGFGVAVCCFGVGFCGFLSPINMLCFLSFYDDLGTPPHMASALVEKRALGLKGFDDTSTRTFGLEKILVELM